VVVLGLVLVLVAAAAAAVLVLVLATVLEVVSEWVVEEVSQCPRSQMSKSTRAC